MKLVVGGTKGGGGKSTLASNLATLLVSNKQRVLLVDGDEQKSLMDWSAQREQTMKTRKDIPPIATVAISGRALNSQVQELSRDYTHVIIDVGGRDLSSQRSAIHIADAILIPFRPRSFDSWSGPQTKMMIDEMKPYNPKIKSYVIINQADSRGQDNKNALEIVGEIQGFLKINTYIGNRKAFPNAASEGLGVIELLKEDPLATKEMWALYNEIFR